MSQSADNTHFFVIGAVITLASAVLASVITVLVAGDHRTALKPHQQIFDGPRAETLANLGVERVKVLRVGSLNNGTGYQVKVHRHGKVTAYQGFYPDTVNLEADVDPDGLVKITYEVEDREELPESTLRRTSEYFIKTATRVARQIQAFDGKVLAKRSVVSE